MIAKIVQTAKQTVKAIVESQSARPWSDGLIAVLDMPTPLASKRRYRTLG